MMTTCKVLFNNGSTMTFRGYWSAIIKAIDAYCDSTGLVTVSASWNAAEN